MSRHIDLWYRNAWTEQWTHELKADEGFMRDLLGRWEAFGAHYVSLAHDEGECENFAPR